MGCLAVLLAQAPAQPPEQPPPAPEPKKEPPPRRDPEDYPYYFGKPETVEEFWSALKFEIEVGQYDLASRFLQGLLDLKPSKDALLELEEKQGMSALLRLRTIPQWSKDSTQDKKAKENV